MKPPEKDREFVPSQARHQIALAYRLPEPPGGFPENLIPRRVSPEIIEGLEPVEVNQNQRPPMLSRGRLAKSPGKSVVEQSPVGNVGEGIGVGGLRQDLIFLEKLRDGREDGGHVGRLPPLPHDGRKGDPEVVALPLLFEGPDRS